MDMKKKGFRPVVKEAEGMDMAAGGFKPSPEMVQNAKKMAAKNAKPAPKKK